MRYFITVDWCNEGNRGIFCDRNGKAFPKDNEPHTEEEMSEVLDLFEIVLNPKSEPFTEEEFKKYRRFKPLAEYSNQYGIASKEVL